MKSSYSKYHAGIFDSKEQIATPFDWFDVKIPLDEFTDSGKSAEETVALVQSECWINANLILNLSSFVVFIEPEARKLVPHHFRKKFADPDVDLHVRGTELRCVKWLRDLWNGSQDAASYGSASIGGSKAYMLAARDRVENEMGRR